MRKKKFPDEKYQDWLYYRPIVPSDYFGFVYIITNKITGKAFVSKKPIYIKDGNGFKMSDWETSFGACDALLRDIEKLGHQNFERRIIEFYKTKEELYDAEIREHEKRNVGRALLPDGTRAYYNGLTKATCSSVSRQSEDPRYRA